jgi:hypothetical protein
MGKMSTRIGFNRGMRSTFARRFVPILSALSLALAAAPAVGQEPKDTSARAAPPSAKALKEARARYTQGTQLFKEGDYKLALIEFQRAYELAPNYRILYNIGAVNYQLNNYVDALRTLERYLAEGGKEIPAKRREEVEQDIKNLKARTAHITIIANVEGAEISIDNTVVGKTPLPASLLVDAGRHQVVATKEGRTTATKSLVLAGSDDAKVELELAEVSTQPSGPVFLPSPFPTQQPQQSSPVIPTQEPDVAPPKSSMVWIGWTATGVFAAGAIATGIGAVVSTGDLKTLRDTPGTTRETLDSKQTQARALAVAADVMGGAAVIAGVVSLVATLTSGSSDKPKPKAHGSSLHVAVGPASVSLTGGF